jgi:plasmid stabilization system protein ParE
VPEIVVAPAAQAWIRRRGQYLADYSREAALDFRDAMRKAARQLASHPNSGPPGLIPGTRRLIVGDYVVSYRTILRRGDVIRVEIFAVRHGRQGDAYDPM